jgi:hypothetical protein
MVSKSTFTAPILELNLESIKAVIPIQKKKKRMFLPRRLKYVGPFLLSLFLCLRFLTMTTQRALLIVPNQSRPLSIDTPPEALFAVAAARQDLRVRDLELEQERYA